MKMPLEGIKVVEIGAFIFGPRTAVHLANMGADVIKIEHPVIGDPERGLRPLSILPNYTLNPAWETDNTNKRSVAVDLSKEAGREIVRKLVKGADIFITNLEMNLLRRWNLDYDSLAQINPRLIYSFASGWGLRGPEKDQLGFDFAAWARSGLMASLGEPGTPPPPCLPGLGDHIASLALAYATMVALHHRDKTGEGQMVHVSLIGTLIDVGSVELQALFFSDAEDMQRVSRKNETNPLWDFYRTKDNRWIQLAMLQTDPSWHDFCEAMGLQELENDPRFNTHHRRCEENGRILIAKLDEVFPTKTLGGWEECFRGKHIIWGYVSTYGQVAKDPQLWANDYIIKRQYPTGQEVNFVGIPFQLSKTPGGYKSWAPELGQQTEEVLMELGYTWDDLTKLKDNGVII